MLKCVCFSLKRLLVEKTEECSKMESFNLCAYVPSQFISEKVIAINTAAKNDLVYKSSNGC